MNSIGKLIEKLPDDFLVQGQCADNVPKIFLNDRLINLPADVDLLKDACTNAPFGMRDQTVFDENFRKTLETSAVRVEWPGLNQLLIDHGMKLAPNMQLTANFYKLLVYRPGDFFRCHRDTSRHDDEHRLTLAIDISNAPIEGGQVSFWQIDPLRFRQGGHYYGDSDGEGVATSSANVDVVPSATPTVVGDDASRIATVWNSSGVAGSFAFWFTSVWHCVQNVTSGNRVMLTFDVLAKQNGNTLLPYRSTDSAVAPFADLEWRSLASHLDLPTYRNLGRTCKNLVRLLIANPAMLLAHSIRHRLPQIRAELKKAHHHSIGFVLRHGYLCKSIEDEQHHKKLSCVDLKGRDRIIAEALRINGLIDIRQKCVEHAVLMEEVNEYADKCRIRIGCTVLSRTDFEKMRYLGYDWHDDDDKVTAETEQIRLQIEKIVGGPVTYNDLSNFGSTYTELDDQLVSVTVPHLGVSWLTHDIDRCFVSSYNDSDSGLWGNQRSFSMFRYSSAVLIARILPEEDTPEPVKFANDL